MLGQCTVQPWCNQNIKVCIKVKPASSFLKNLIRSIQCVCIKKQGFQTQTNPKKIMIIFFSILSVKYTTCGPDVDHYRIVSNALELNFVKIEQIFVSITVTSLFSSQQKTIGQSKFNQEWATETTCVVVVVTNSVRSEITRQSSVTVHIIHATLVVFVSRDKLRAQQPVSTDTKVAWGWRGCTIFQMNQSCDDVCVAQNFLRRQQREFYLFIFFIIFKYFNTTQTQ